MLRVTTPDKINPMPALSVKTSLAELDLKFSQSLDNDLGVYPDDCLAKDSHPVQVPQMRRVNSVPAADTSEEDT